MKKLILASQSPGRKEALEKAGFVFEILPSNYEEKMDPSLSPAELVIKLSQGKGRDVAEKVSDAIVIGADTVGVFEGMIMGKPHTVENCIKMLSDMCGKVHSMLTGITIIDTETKQEISRCVETKVYLKDMDEEEIKEYAESGEGLEKAGGYAYQGAGHKFVERVEGSETNIIGMPIEILSEILKSFDR